MSGKWFIIGCIFATVVILIGGVYILSATNSPQITASENAKAQLLNSNSFDWGNIPMHKGNVTKTFSIQNTGKDVLKLYNIKTSCHCTKARVSIEGAESPDFGMSTVSSWTGEVMPGKQAQLTVIFDPAFHGPQGVGPINRFVSAETNDKSNPKLTFTVTGTVVK
ncbi:MAG: hypothetical protein A3F31_00280 [Candidatus Levybacteria bacterium RIFCSPHIGHO2_12_FULL_38_12]|nr:MAG: hypothetical protein A2770_03350 [Candidatus Levybacteria bacterium RIFCSPHIGHO2_01_FULL_38_12]OGH23197.1 MAG: hypothetical protein A3F31_00280 [Candidatus Levybacteria bacterium RIFCSPHIGHO2_12_FULL_38_12]OGH34475.1 MAG: hypothetical protein A3A47_00800 [Candidatus Levybacteria bacterium RIFCSPLOWO2_01_FULL_37_20]OGH44723.1 MAG: hypothetical protein A3J14_00160 [Candidatus Levybacteria bacterium RIFCSPLOWO2_02_FULL_37_18]